MATLGATKTSRASRKDDLKRVESELRDRVSSGAWVPGEMVPSRRDLAIEFSVDLNTVQRAMTPLLADGTLLAENGRGTFVPQQRSQAVPDRATASLARPATKTIGVTAFFNDDLAALGEELPATHTILKSMEDEAGQSGAKSVFVNRWRRGQEELSPADCVRDLLAAEADCVAVLDVYSHPFVLSELRAMDDLADLPVIYVSAVDHYVPCAHVYFDNRDAGYKAAELLIQAGHRKITFLTPYSGRWVELRSDGARIACEQRREPVSFRVYPGCHEISVYESDAAERARDIVAELAEEFGLSGGIIAPHDILALEIVEEGVRRNLVAGVDYGVVGFDDVPAAFSRGLSTVRPPLELIGAEAIRLANLCLADGRWNRVVSLRAQAIGRNTHTTSE